MLHRIHRAHAIVAVVAFAIFPAVAQQAPRDPVLRRHVSTPSESTSIDQHVLTLFNSASVHGGIAIVSDQCREPLEQFPEFDGDLEEALQRLASTGHHLHWLQVGDGLVLYNTASPPALLTVAVRDFHFSRKQALAKSSASLFGTPEVSDKARSLHLVEYGPNLGFAQPLQAETPQDMVTLSNATVVEVLNSIAGNHGVWLYKESRCEANVMSLNWPVR